MHLQCQYGSAADKDDEEAASVTMSTAPTQFVKDVVSDAGLSGPQLAASIAQYKALEDVIHMNWVEDISSIYIEETSQNEQVTVDPTFSAEWVSMPDHIFAVSCTCSKITLFIRL